MSWFVEEYILVTIAIIPTDIIFMFLLVLISLAFLGIVVGMDLVLHQKYSIRPSSSASPKVFNQA